MIEVSKALLTPVIAVVATYIAWQQWQTNRQKLNLETAQMSWPELQRYFARGVVVVVSPELDLIDVAARFAEDDKQSVDKWIRQGRLARANDEHARRWQANQETFWAVVIAPWVIVQEISPQ